VAKWEEIAQAGAVHDRPDDPSPRVVEVADVTASGGAGQVADERNEKEQCAGRRTEDEPLVQSAPIVRDGPVCGRGPNERTQERREKPAPAGGQPVHRAWMTGDYRGDHAKRHDEGGSRHGKRDKASGPPANVRARVGHGLCHLTPSRGGEFPDV
jgi:hypothetical protein